MRAILLAMTLCSAMPAWADLTDAGNLVIGGTATVSGQDASGYSIRLASSVQSGGCYKFGDGTTQCTAGGTGSGNAVLSATQTWSGGNTLYGSTTFYGWVALAAGSTMTHGPTVYSTTATFTGVRMNDWNTVAVTSVTNATSLYFYGLSSSFTATSATKWELECTGVKHGANYGPMDLGFNGTEGSTLYTYSGGFDYPTVAFLACNSGPSYTLWGIFRCGNGPGAEGPFKFKLEFNSVPGDPTFVVGMWQTHVGFTNNVGANSNGSGIFSGRWDGSSALSSLRFWATLDTFDAKCYLRAFVSNL